MRAWMAHHGAADTGKLDEELASLGSPLTLADRACCCPARPVVRVVMPAVPGRPHPVDLLLCGHHYRVSRGALRAAGATVYDEAGLPITDHDAGYLGASRRSAAAVGRSQGLGRPWQPPGAGVWQPASARWLFTLGAGGPEVSHEWTFTKVSSGYRKQSRQKWDARSPATE